MFKATPLLSHSIKLICRILSEFKEGGFAALAKKSSRGTAKQRGATGIPQSQRSVGSKIQPSEVVGGGFLLLGQKELHLGVRSGPSFSCHLKMVNFSFQALDLQADATAAGGDCFIGNEFAEKLEIGRMKIFMKMHAGQ